MKGSFSLYSDAETTEIGIFSGVKESFIAIKFSKGYTEHVLISSRGNHWELRSEYRNTLKEYYSPEVMNAIDKKIKDINKEQTIKSLKKLLLFFVKTLIIITILTFLGLKRTVTPSKVSLELDSIKDNNQEIFKRIKYRNGRDNIDYTYCESLESIYEVIADDKNKRLIIVCKNDFKSAHSHSRYFKYSVLYHDGQVAFCGWRDFSYEFNHHTGKWEDKFDDSSSDLNFIARKTEHCRNFDISGFKHRSEQSIH